MNAERIELEQKHKRGWYVWAGEAHYAAEAHVSLCGSGLATLNPWTVPEHCGAIPLCADCRAVLFFVGEGITPEVP